MKKKIQKVDNLYNLSDDAVYRIQCKEQGWTYGSRSSMGTKFLSVLFLAGTIIALSIGLIIQKPVEAFSLAAVFLLFVILNIVSYKEIKRSYMDAVVKSYNNFYENVKGKPFLPVSDEDIEAFFVWMHGEPCDFEEKLISEETYMQIGLAYGQSMGDEYDEEDENGNVIRTVRYFHTAKRQLGMIHFSDSSHSLKELALAYQIYKIYSEVK